MRPTEITLAVFEKYQPAELAEVAQKMAQAQSDMESAEAEKKVSDGVFNERIKTHAAEVSELAQRYNKGGETAQIGCTIRYDIPDSRQEIVHPHGHRGNGRSARHVRRREAGDIPVPADCRASRHPSRKTLQNRRGINTAPQKFGQAEDRDRNHIQRYSVDCRSRGHHDRRSATPRCSTCKPPSRNACPRRKPSSARMAASKPSIHRKRRCRLAKAWLELALQPAAQPPKR